MADWVAFKSGRYSPPIVIYGHLVPDGNRAAVDRLDDETQPSATPAQRGIEPGGPQEKTGRARICSLSPTNWSVLGYGE
jgi:hypothetical protein